MSTTTRPMARALPSQRSMMRASGSWKVRAEVAEALNFGLQMCSCDIVARLDADDVFAAGQLLRHAARFAELRRSGRGVAVLGGGAVSWWPDGARAPLMRCAHARS